MSTDCPLCGETVGELPDHLRRNCTVAKSMRSEEIDKRI